MIIVMKAGATMKEVSSVLKQIEAQGFKPHMSKGEETTVIGVIDPRTQARHRQLPDASGRREGDPHPQAL